MRIAFRATASTKWDPRAWAAILELGAEPVPAIARHQESVRDGRRRLPVRRVPEPDAHDHGAGRPLDRLSDGAAQETEYLDRLPFRQGWHCCRAGRIERAPIYMQVPGLAQTSPDTLM